MSHWNHRVIKKTNPDGLILYSIREVYYNEDGTIFSYMEEPLSMVEETVEELKETLQRCLKSLDTPILIDGEIECKDDFDPIS